MTVSDVATHTAIATVSDVASYTRLYSNTLLVKVADTCHVAKYVHKHGYLTSYRDRMLLLGIQHLQLGLAETAV